MTDIDMNGSSAPAVSEFGVHSESPPSHDREDGHITLEELGELINDAASTGFPNNNGSKCRYTEVRVLLISWADESSFDMHVREEILGLGLVLAERYNFSVEKYQIPHGTRSHSALAMKVLQLAHYDGEDVDRKGVDGWGRENILKIVYYGGHGYLANNRDLCWCNRTKESGPYYSVVQWSGIQSTLVASESDVLIILGCCSSGVASPSLGNGSSELIATCGFHEEANGTGPKSFTKALIHELYAMSGMTSFTAAELYTRILSRLHGHISDCEDHEQMKAPIHVMLNHRTTSIHGPAIRLSAMRPSSPPTELVHIPASKSADGAWDSTNNTPGAPSPASLPSSVSSVSMQEGKSSTFLLSVKLKEDHNLESLTGAVADWIKAVPVSAESIKFEAAYRIFSTLIIIFMPGAMWCYFKRHPAITCLGIVTPGPIITRNELNIAVKEKLALEQGEKRKQRQNPDADCYKQSLR
ncbi:hypothetical protein DID88_001636 [Monilinia fructigena]|uniref:Uncharacterized protein n=1 Tax=Monilinia fructigena TaxID=38457 RepID=A0A395IYV5_9HELO|nr:hypothetical protein DID88_001636 [Monilinia fructigena]